MKYIFDTDSISFLYGDSTDKEKIAIIKNMQKMLGSDRLQASVLVLFELEYSHFLATPEKQSLIKKIIENTEKNFEILPLKKQVAVLYAELKGKLKQQYKISTKNMKRHNIDIMLASTAIAENATVISPDTLYPKLAKIHTNFQYENWTL